VRVNAPPEQAFEVFTAGIGRWWPKSHHIGAADPDVFTPAVERGSAVLLSSAFYPRKHPERLLALVQQLPDERFVLLGKGWQQWARFDALRACPNFTYLDEPYDAYPDHYRRAGVFLSLSTMEGGPIPLLEAMCADLIPVASRTGFAPDVIQHGSNGFLFEPDAPVAPSCGDEPGPSVRFDVAL